MLLRREGLVRTSRNRGVSVAELTCATFTTGAELAVDGGTSQLR